MITMVTTNKSQLIAAFGCVQEDSRTEGIVIEARGDDDRLLCRYKFPKHPGDRGMHTYNAGTPQYHSRLKRIIGAVRKTPAAVWR